MTFGRHKYIIELWQTKVKGGLLMSPRTGRPTDNPKAERITVRLDEKSADIMKKYCEQEKVDKAEAVRRGLKKLESEIKK